MFHWVSKPDLARRKAEKPRARQKSWGLIVLDLTNTKREARVYLPQEVVNWKQIKPLNN